jgi:ABC-type branched-subunit amino acid transport system permease subunit
VSYPLAAAGAILVGLLESFSSFQFSQWKEVIVFSLILPVLLWRSLTSHHVEEEGMSAVTASRPRNIRPVLAALFFAALAAAPLLLPEFSVTLLGYIGLFSLVALGLVLLTGVAGSTSFGQAAFMGVGAYSTAILTTRYDMNPWLSLFVALLITGGVALLLGALTLRMQGHYLPLATIAWGISLYYAFGNATTLTGGFTGLREIPPSACSA